MTRRFSDRASGLGGVLVLAACFALACSPGPPPPIDPGYAPASQDFSREGQTPERVAAFSDVAVVADALPADRIASFHRHDAGSILRRAVFAELQQQGRIDRRGDRRLEIRVTGFRLRSTSTSVWVGSMAGNDKLAVAIDVVVGDAVVRTFTSEVASIKGGLFFPSSSGRLNNLALALARQVVAELSMTAAEAD